MRSILCNKLLSRTYTIRFIFTPHYDNVYGLTMIPPVELLAAISNFCKGENIILKKTFISDFEDSALVQPNNSSLRQSSSNFVQIKGIKKDFLSLYDFLLKYEEDGFIALLTIR